MRNRWIPALTTATLLAACGSQHDPADATGDDSYSAAVTGALTAAIAGPAHFGDDSSQGEPYFAIVLGSSSSAHLLVLARLGSGRPGPGTYQVIDPTESSAAGDWTALHLIAAGNDPVLSLLARSGELTITSSEARQLKGTFRYVAEGFVSSGQGNDLPVAVTVAGSFNAGQTSGIGQTFGATR